jgi:hypothetical protein
LGEQVTELLGAHPHPGAEVIGKYDALLGWSGFVDEQLRAPAAALAAEGGQRLGSSDVEHDGPPVSLPEPSKVLA